MSNEERRPANSQSCKVLRTRRRSWRTSFLLGGLGVCNKDVNMNMVFSFRIGRTGMQEHLYRPSRLSLTVVISKFRIIFRAD